MEMIGVLAAGPYNVLYAGGFALAFAVAAWEGRRRGWPMLPWLTLLAACVAGGIAGSKLFHFDLHVAAPGEKTILGGLLGGMLALLIVQRLLRVSEHSSRVLAPAALLGFALGRVGCFLAGCCFGTPTSLPWGVTYEAGTRPFVEQLSAGLIDPGAAASLAIHPTQLYEALLALLLAAALWRWGSHLRSAAAPALVLAAGYGLIRFGVEFYRAGGAESLYHGLKVVQWTVGAVALTAALVLLWRENRATRAEPVPRLGPGIDGPEGALLVLGGVLALLLLGGGWLTPLERTVLGAGLLPAGAVLLRDLLGSVGWQRVPGFVTATLVLVPFTLDTIPGYPRSYVTIGGSAALGEYETIRDLSPGDDCGPTEIRNHEYAVLGISGGYTHLESPEESYSARVSIFNGSNRIVRIDGRETNQDVPIRGLSASGSLDWRWVGLTGGLVGGRLIDSDGVPTTTADVIAGVRAGLRHGFFYEIRYNDHEPSPFPDTRLKTSIGHGLDRDGSNVHLGAWENGLFLGGRWVTRGGLEIEPMLGLGDGETAYQLGIAVRQRFSPRLGLPW